MTFVYRSRNQSQVFDPTPGPGSYDLDKKSDKIGSVVTQLPIGEMPRKMSPGPGQYDGRKQNSINQIASAVFKNEEERFKDDKKNLVGPGYYESQMMQKQKQSLSHRPKIIEQLMFAGSYQTANSIPYEKREQINVGPGYYDLQMKKQGSIVSDWSRRSTKQEELEPTIGPGHYDIDRFYKYRYSKSKQQSKLHTSFDSKCYVKKGLDKKIYFSFHKSSTPDSDSSQYEYIDDATPGPGYYQTTQSTTQSTGTKFLSKVPRFTMRKMSGLGPGSYNPAEINLNQSIEFQKAERFQSNRITQSPSPVSYSPKVTMKDQLIQKLISSPNQEIGSKLPRNPKKKREKPSPGPGYYETLKKDESKKEVSLSPFKSNAKRTSLVKNENLPAPGAYNIQLGSIEDKLQLQMQYLNDQMIEKPPFGVGEKRWKNAIIEESDEDKNERSPNIKKPEAKEQPAFGIGQNRFRNKNDDFPDPSAYNINLPWVKKSFNFLYVKK